MNKKNISLVLVIILCIVIGVVLCGCVNKCSVENCDDKRVEYSNFCEKHACAVKNCEKRNVKGDFNFCDEHKCPVERCNNKKIKEGENCKNHVECYSGNGYIRIDCKNKAIFGSAYCADHKCKVKNCMKVVNKIYCEGHECDGYIAETKSYCRNLASYNLHESYCEECMCKEDGCDDYTEGLNGYCYVHTTYVKSGKTSYNGGALTPKEEYELYYKDKEYDNWNNDVDTNKCKSCSKEFPAGDSGRNYMNIAKTGMCKKCYNNYKSMSEWVN